MPGVVRADDADDGATDPPSPAQETTMTRPANRRSPYRITRRMAALHRRHTAGYPGCVLCIIGAVPAR